MIFDLQDVEEKLHYEFRDKELIYRAFTHSSYSNEIQQRSGEKPGNNEVLEFLGDSILNFVVAEELFRLLPDADQGELTQKRAEIVSKPPCAEAVEKLGLHEHIIFGVGAEAEKTRNHRAKGDLLEAVLAAVYLDGGMGPARDFVFLALGGRIREAARPQKPARPAKKTPERAEPEHPAYTGFPMFLGKAEHPPEDEEDELIFTEQPQPFVSEAPKKKKSRSRREDPTTSFSAAQKRARPTFGAQSLEFRGDQGERKPEQVGEKGKKAVPAQDETRTGKKGKPAQDEVRTGKKGKPAQDELRTEKKRKPAQDEPRTGKKGKPAQDEVRTGKKGKPAQDEGKRSGGGSAFAGSREPEQAAPPQGRNKKPRREEKQSGAAEPGKIAARPSAGGGRTDPRREMREKPEKRPSESGRGETSFRKEGNGPALPEERGEDFKSRLQEYCQKHYRQSPVYETLGQAGPSHEPEFSVRVSFSGVMLAQGRGKSKRAAEQAAARDALELLMLPPSDKKGKRKSSKERKH